LWARPSNGELLAHGNHMWMTKKNMGCFSDREKKVKFDVILFEREVINDQVQTFLCQLVLNFHVKILM
jgi:hypothetical protein